MGKNDLYVDELRKEFLLNKYIEQLFYTNVPISYEKGKCLSNK